MPIPLLSADQFVSTVLATPERGLAYLVGAPISNDGGGGVPGVGGLVEIMREVAAEDDYVNEAAFGDALPDTKDAGEVYRAAMGWWGDEGGGIDRINQIVRRAVMRACTNPGALGNPPTHEGEPGDWHLPKGVRDLAALVCSGEEKFAGPILTTNFDPLLELAIRKEGGLDRSVAIDYRDGSIPEFHLRERPVVHLHGYWLKSDTLNTALQLEQERSKLRRSLERLLRHRRLVVVSYGGWNDVFTRALIGLVRDEGMEVDVVWGFYEDDPEVIEQKYAALIDGVRPEIGNRFKAYGGVDAHVVFGEMVARVQEKQGERIALAMQGEEVAAELDVEGASPLSGWTLVDDTFLGSLPELSDEEAVRYFDGVVPTWRHALSDAIPRRERVAELVADLDRAAGQGGASSLHLILAASGEGKSTLLLQTAVDVSRREGWQVLARSAPGLALDPDEVFGLDDRGHWLIVSDDAEELVDDLRACARQLHEKGKRNVHFLLAARDTDWRWRGQKARWENWLQCERPEPLRGVTDDDAAALVAAWERLGDEALGALAEVEPKERVAAFQNAVQASKKGGGQHEGALLGGLLEARYGADALRAHVRSLLERLQEVPIRGSARTLYDALVYIAACHCGRGPGLSLPVLADLLGVDREWVGTEVLRPLGEEAVAVGGAATARTRHLRISEAVVQEADATFETDLAEVWNAIVRRTIGISRDERIERSNFNYIAHAGPHLVDDLKMLPPERRSAVALAAADAAVKARPERLDAVVDLAKTHRSLGQPAEGAAVLRTRRDMVADKRDYDDAIRGYWYEWSACEGEAGDYPADAWVGGLSLSDHLLLPDQQGVVPITDIDVKLIAAGLGVAFGKLASGGDAVFARALRAAAVVGMAGLDTEEQKTRRKDHRARGYFTKNRKEADRLGAPQPEGLVEAVDWLEAGIRAAHALLKDAELAGLAAPEAVTFLTLRAHLGVGDSQLQGRPAPKKARSSRRKDRGPAPFS